MLAEKRSTPPPPPTTDIKITGLSVAVLRAFNEYCDRRGYRRNRAIEFLMRDAVRQKRRLSLRGITPPEE